MVHGRTLKNTTYTISILPAGGPQKIFQTENNPKTFSTEDIGKAILKILPIEYPQKIFPIGSILKTTVSKTDAKDVVFVNASKVTEKNTPKTFATQTIMQIIAIGRNRERMILESSSEAKVVHLKTFTTLNNRKVVRLTDIYHTIKTKDARQTAMRIG